ncbi:hypothetical protein VNI00_014816 [Paramarasmius palmivorus]|uniref:Uncharacterized protein n=1 Tax=Paramarasmius palmivorus TaxID=297713 RepID=A0AAW0BU01_9AGAR
MNGVPSSALRPQPQSPGEQDRSGYSSDGSLDEFIQSVLDEPCSDVESTATREPPLPPDYYASDEDDILDAFVRQNVQHAAPDSPSPPPRVASTSMMEECRKELSDARQKLVALEKAQETAMNQLRSAKGRVTQATNKLKAGRALPARPGKEREKEIRITQSEERSAQAVEARDAKQSELERAATEVEQGKKRVLALLAKLQELEAIQAELVHQPERQSQEEHPRSLPVSPLLPEGEKSPMQEINSSGDKVSIPTDVPVPVHGHHPPNTAEERTPEPIGDDHRSGVAVGVNTPIVVGIPSQLQSNVDPAVVVGTAGTNGGGGSSSSSEPSHASHPIAVAQASTSVAGKGPNAAASAASSSTTDPVDVPVVVRDGMVLDEEDLLAVSAPPKCKGSDNMPERGATPKRVRRGTDSMEVEDSQNQMDNVGERLEITDDCGSAPTGVEGEPTANVNSEAATSVGGKQRDKGKGKAKVQPKQKGEGKKKANIGPASRVKAIGTVEVADDEARPVAELLDDRACISSPFDAKEFSLEMEEKIRDWLKLVLKDPAKLKEVSPPTGTYTYIMSDARLAPEVAYTAQEIAEKLFVSQNAAFKCVCHSRGDKQTQSWDHPDEFFGIPWEPFPTTLKKMMGQHMWPPVKRDAPAPKTLFAARYAPDVVDRLADMNQKRLAYNVKKKQTLELRVEPEHSFGGPSSVSQGVERDSFGRDVRCMDCGCLLRHALMYLALWKMGRIGSITHPGFFMQGNDSYLASRDRQFYLEDLERLGKVRLEDLYTHVLVTDPNDPQKQIFQRKNPMLALCNQASRIFQDMHLLAAKGFSVPKEFEQLGDFLGIATKQVKPAEEKEEEPMSLLDQNNEEYLEQGALRAQRST